MSLIAFEMEHYALADQCCKCLLLQPVLRGQRRVMLMRNEKNAIKLIKELN